MGSSVLQACSPQPKLSQLSLNDAAAPTQLDRKLEMEMNFLRNHQRVTFTANKKIQLLKRKFKKIAWQIQMMHSSVSITT